ncbi:DUF3833 domain-containing protein [Vibrio tritonius]|uniref:DUF3833 domain-containing protein n=1 Tax=Vibrio tritonius TaxID=1435069 RepID=UPI00315CA435
MIRCLAYTPRWVSIVLVVAMALILTSCSADIEDYQGTSPKFELFDYFSGESEAWGMVQDYSGQQTRRFHVKLNGVVKQNQLILDEQFVYDDGETERRVWTITRGNDGQYIGTANGVIGKAIGEEVGNALRWQYRFHLKTESYDIDVDFDDWLYRQDELHLFNTTTISKWGVTLGKVTLFFAKKPLDSSAKE